MYIYSSVISKYLPLLENLNPEDASSNDGKRCDWTCLMLPSKILDLKVPSQK